MSKSEQSYNSDMSPDNIVILEEIAQLQTKHSIVSKELKQLTNTLDLAIRLFNEGKDKIRLFNVERAVHEKEMKEMQGHIFALKKRRDSLGTNNRVEEEFERQEDILTSLRETQRELNKKVITIESDTRLFEKTLSDKTAIIERLSANIGGIRPKRDALSDELSHLEVTATIFIEAEKLSTELDMLQSSVSSQSAELDTLTSFILEAEPEIETLDTQISLLQRQVVDLELANKEIKELSAKKAALIETVDTLEEKDRALRHDSSRLKDDLDKKSSMLAQLKTVNDPNRTNAASLETELLKCNEQIAGIKTSIDKYGTTKKKKDLELDKLEKSLVMKLGLEDELSTMEEGVATLGGIVRSIP